MASPRSVVRRPRLQLGRPLPSPAALLELLWLLGGRTRQQAAGKASKSGVCSGVCAGWAREIAGSSDELRMMMSRDGAEPGFLASDEKNYVAPKSSSGSTLE